MSKADTIIRQAAALAGLATLVSGVAGSATAQDNFPSEPIEVVMHAGLGGGADTVTRMMTLQARRELGADMVVVQKTGGAGAAALNYVATRAPDGHTVFTYFPGHIIAILQDKVPLDREDILPLALGNVEPNLLFVRSNSEIETIEDLVREGKERAITFGGTAVGAIDHIGVISFANRAGIQQPNYIPYQGGGAVLSSLMTGDIEVAIGNVSEAPQLDTGDVRALAVLSRERIESLPDVPTASEQGVNAVSEVVRGWAVHADTPPEQVEILEEAILKAMEHPLYVNYLVGSGMSPSSPAGRKEFGEQVDELYDTYREALEQLGLL